MNGPRDSIHASGTVFQRLARSEKLPGRALHPREHALLEHALQAGLSAHDFYVAKKMNAMATASGFALLCLLLCERLAFSEGSTYLGLEPESLGARLKILGLETAGLEETLTKIVEILDRERFLISDDPDEKRAIPFFFDRRHNALLRQVQYRAEQRVAEGLRGRLALAGEDPRRLREAFARITETYPLGNRPWRHEQNKPWRALQLEPEQKLAALAAMRSPLTIITGGPGTGKTSIVVTILRLLAENGVPLEKALLAAPTGRAANRMAESIRAGLNTIHPEGRHPALLNWDEEPQTLHRLLGFSPTRGQFTRNRENPIEADYLIVDECSMADLMLMESLFNALQTKTSLILLGDANQLPSVDAGAVFKDLVTAAGETAPPLEDPWQAIEWLRRKGGTLAAHVIALRRSFRQSSGDGGGHILEIAARIQQPSKAGLFDGETGRPIEVLQADASWPWQGVCLVSPDQISVRALAERLFQRFYTDYHRLSTKCFDSFQRQEKDLAELFAYFDRLRILCLTRATALGVEHLNQLFQQRFYQGDPWFYPGVPWMVTRNDYRRGLFNGDIGIALWQSGEAGQRRRWLVFRDASGFKPIPFESLTALEPAFAMTVHKSQGSEMDHVVLVLPDQAHHLCKKEVIYTALTRAKRSVLVYGNPDLLSQAVAQETVRTTGLKRNLEAKGAPGKAPS